MPEAASGYRYDDAAFRITWPLPVAVISGQDLSWAAFNTQNTIFRA
jgi:dTDP-4-dehydrorhamnose 3,5-epimerase